MGREPGLDSPFTGQLPGQPCTSARPEGATRTRRQERLLEPELPPPSAAPGGVTAGSQVGKPPRRLSGGEAGVQKAAARGAEGRSLASPCRGRGQKWETGTG